MIATFIKNKKLKKDHLSYTLCGSVVDVREMINVSLVLHLNVSHLSICSSWVCFGVVFFLCIIVFCVCKFVSVMSNLE